MSIYVAHSPYRMSSSRSKLRISFPKLGGLFKKKAVAGVASSAVRVGGGQGISLQERRLRREGVSHSGSCGGNVYAGVDRASGGKKKSDVSAIVAGAANNVCGAVMKFRFSPITAIVGLFVVGVLMGLGYLTHFNQVATKGYDLRRLEADRQQLMNQNDIKNMKIAEAQSMARVIGSDRVSVMRRPAQLIYVRGNTALASR
jgi:hypothetical protein